MVITAAAVRGEGEAGSGSGGAGVVEEAVEAQAAGASEVGWGCDYRMTMIDPSICLFVCLSVYLFISVSICLVLCDL